MASNAGTLFSLALVAFFAWALYSAQGFRRQARLFPIVIGVTGLALAIVVLGLELWLRRALRPGLPAGQAGSAPAPGLPLLAGAGSAQAAMPESLASPESPPPAVVRRRTAAILGWILGFSLGIWLLGFPIAVPLAALAYLKLGAGESWTMSLVFAAACGVVFHAVFVQAVRIPFETGVLIALLSG